MTPCYYVCEVMEQWLSSPFVADSCISTNAKTYFFFIKTVWSDDYEAFALYLSPSLSVCLPLSNPNTHVSSPLALIQPIMRDRRGITVFYCELGRLTAVLWLIIRVFNCSWGTALGLLIGRSLEPCSGDVGCCFTCVYTQICRHPYTFTLYIIIFIFF